MVPPRRRLGRLHSHRHGSSGEMTRTPPGGGRPRSARTFPHHPHQQQHKHTHKKKKNKHKSQPIPRPLAPQNQQRHAQKSRATWGAASCSRSRRRRRRRSRSGGRGWGRRRRAAEETKRIEGSGLCSALLFNFRVASLPRFSRLKRGSASRRRRGGGGASASAFFCFNSERNRAAVRRGIFRRVSEPGECSRRGGGLVVNSSSTSRPSRVRDRDLCDEWCRGRTTRG